MNLNKDCECSKCTFSVDSNRIWIPRIQNFQHFMERDSKRTNKKKQVSYDIDTFLFQLSYKIRYHSHFSKTFSLLLCVQLSVNKCFLVTELSLHNTKLSILYQPLAIRTVWSLWSFRLKSDHNKKNVNIKEFVSIWRTLLYLDVEQFLVPSSKATEARVFKLVLPDWDMVDTGKPTCSVILFNLSTYRRQNIKKQLVRY